MLAVYSLADEQPLKVAEVDDFDCASELAHALGLTWGQWGVFDLSSQEWFEPMGQIPFGFVKPANIWEEEPLLQTV